MLKRISRFIDNNIYKGRGSQIAPLLAFFYAITWTFGYQLKKHESVNFKSLGVYLSIVILTAVLWLLISAVYKRLSTFVLSIKQSRTKCINDFYPGISWRLCFASFIFIGWLPTFLAVYPGFFCYDASDEYIQVATRMFSTHHPLIHVLLLGGSVCAGNKFFESYNIGIAAYTLFQMAILAIVFGTVVARLKKTWIQVAALLYLIFFPVIPMFALCSAKDGLFSAFLLLTCIGIYEYESNPEGFVADIKKPLLLVVFAVLMMSFRKNGAYAFLVASIVLIIYEPVREGFKAQKGKKKNPTPSHSIIFGALLLGAFFLFIVCDKGLAIALNADSGEHQELLTVPIQQMARVYAYDNSEMSAEEKAALMEILPLEALERYTPKVSDGVKYYFDNAAYEANPKKYQNLWFKLGVKHPFTYLNAWFMTSYGFWYPGTIVDVYKGNSVFTFTYGDSSYFGFETEEPGIRHSRFTLLEEFYRFISLDPTLQKIPVISLLFSMGFMLDLYLFMAGLFFITKKMPALMALLPIFMVVLTVLLGPTYLPRYVLILWFYLPVLIGQLFGGDKC